VPYTITSPGYYYLGGNIFYKGSKNAITVNADNVTIDLMGFCLSSTGEAPNGIYIAGRLNVEIRNGTVTGFVLGVGNDVYSQNGNDYRIINIRALKNVLGIQLYGNNNLVKNCDASFNGDGLTVIGSARIVDNIVSACTNVGITFTGPGLLIGNTVINNQYNNIYINAGNATAILVSGNCSFGAQFNYEYLTGTTGIVKTTGTNAGF